MGAMHNVPPAYARPGGAIRIILSRIPPPAAWLGPSDRSRFADIADEQVYSRAILGPRFVELAGVRTL